MDPADKSAKALEWVKAMGMPLVTLAVTVFGGYYFTNLTQDREARESNERLYAQILTQREQSDATIRKDMFGVVIKDLLTGAKPGDWNNKVLQLELLAINFNQSLDLAPLFKDLARKLAKSTDLTRAQNAELRKRLDQTAANVIFRQVSSLARSGIVEREVVPLAGWESRFGKPFIERTIPKSWLVQSTPNVPVGDKEKIRFAVEILRVDIERREVEVRLHVHFFGDRSQDVDRHFWVGQYDFPMLDNTQLPHGLRASVVITDFNVPDEMAEFHLIVFTASGASFKERQDYDDILNDMLRAKGKPARRESEQPELNSLQEAKQPAGAKSQTDGKR